jgi:hypothetical protein
MFDAEKLTTIFYGHYFTPNELILGSDHASIVREHVILRKDFKSLADFEACSPELVIFDLDGCADEEKEKRAVLYYVRQS